MRLAGSTVLITGATGGLGRAIARHLAAEDARLLLSGRREEDLLALGHELGAEVLRADLAVREDVAALAAWGARAEVLVANAALPASGALESFTEHQLDRALEVNLRAPVALAHALLPHLRSRGRGHLVFVSSLSGLSAAELSSLYSATKFGLRGFALALRADLHGTGISASVLCPGFIAEEGMFADTGVRLPFPLSTREPAAVAAAVVRAVERDVAEIDVAPPLLRWGARLACAAPALAARVSRASGSARVARAITSTQADRR